MTTEPVLPAGARVVRLDTVDSTNAEALRRLEEGATSGTVVWARRQTAGRGRRGRHWESPPGNLYATLVAEAASGRPVSQLAFIMALAAGDSLLPLLPPERELSFKWPNDLLLDSCKLGGILIEGSAVVAPMVAIGFGINIDNAPPGAACLAGAGVAIAPEALLSSICSAYAARAEEWRARGFAPIRAAWLERAHGLGEPLVVRFADGGRDGGVFRDIDPDGALVLERADGTTRLIATGEVFFAAA